MATVNSILLPSAISSNPANPSLRKALPVTSLLAPLTKLATLTPLLAGLTKKHPGGTPQQLVSSNLFRQI